MGTDTHLCKRYWFCFNIGIPAVPFSKYNGGTEAETNRIDSIREPLILGRSKSDTQSEKWRAHPLNADTLNHLIPLAI